MSIAARRAVQVAVVLLLILGIGFATTPVQAQVELKPGVRVGVTAASFGGEEDEFADRYSEELLVGTSATTAKVSMGVRTGLTAGGFLVVDLSGPLVVQPEFRYVQRGYGIDVELSDGSQTVTIEGTFRFNYIDIPMLVRYDIPAPGFSPYLLAGPIFGFNVSSEFETEGLGRAETEDITDETSDTNFGLELGAGVGFNLGRGELVVDARYGLGVTNVNRDSEDTVLQNRAFIITAGFVF